jgi:hypothetical protein
MSFARWSKILAGAALLMVTTQAALAQKNVNTGPKYDVSGEIKVKGVVDDVREVPGDFAGTQLIVKTDTGTVVVHLAPGAFLKEMDSTFKKGDEILVIGAKAPDGSTDILAREVTVGTNTTTLRDDKGIPVWTGWKPPKSN